jgi:hypothetical protein
MQSNSKDFGNYFFKDICEWIEDNPLPEDIFSNDVLEKWAIENGWSEKLEEEESDT